MKITTLVFDIGNVVLDFDFSIVLGKVAKAISRPAVEIAGWFADSDFEREFELGKIEPEAFFAAVQEAFDLPYDFEAFRDLWNDIFTLTLGMATLLEELKREKRLIAATNTNALHLAFIREHYPILELFESVIASCEIGYRKPDPEFYREVTRRAGVDPASMLLIDDLETNVDGASLAGMHSLLFSGTDDLRRRLKASGIHPVA